MKMHRFILTACVLLALTGSAYAYDVSVPHVIINQIFGGTGGYVSHNFIELYNPTDETVDLTGYALHYRSSPADTSGYADKWYKQDLAGSIPAHHSYLVRCAEDTTYTRTDRTIMSYDISFVGGGT